MISYKNVIFVIQIILFSFCLGDLSIEKRNKLLNGFIDFFNNLPNQIYTTEKGTLQNAQINDGNCYKIDVTLKVADIKNIDTTKYLKCTSTVQDLQENGVTILNNEYQCRDQANENSDDDVVTTETAVERRPVQLDNEVQTNTALTSGEQFIAIPREEQGAPCIGCATHVNPQAAGVTELASLGVRHLDRHTPNVRHSLNGVVDVERQVQVINGVRYILTLLIDYDNCTETVHDKCQSTKSCKITILEKPWARSANGGKYRAILANNCTEEWHFGDNGEVVDEYPTNNKENNDIDINPKTDSAGDDIINAVHSTNVQSQQNQERTLTNDEIKKLEEQIIPRSQFIEKSITESGNVVSVLPDISKEHVTKVETKKHNSDNSISPPGKGYSSLSDNKKKAIDDLVNFLDFAGLSSEPVVENIARIKRSYNRDLEVISLAKKKQHLQNSINNGKYLYTLAQTMVDYLNEIDLEVKSRILEEVVNAEEELENYQHFYYVQARIIIPCKKAECEPKDTMNKICNGVIDTTDEERPQILNAFCHNEQEETILNEIDNVPLGDPVLLNLAKEGVKKIESESSTKKAMKINKIISANTQKASGTLTKFSVILEFLNCSKSTPLALRKKCTVESQLGSNLCEVIIHERYWLKEQKISYNCIERPIDTSFSNQVRKENGNIDDPKVQEMVQEALQYLEVQSNRNNKQKIVAINFVTTQLTAGLLTKIEFVVGYTACSHGIEVDLNTCQLLEKEPLRECMAQIWDRTWIEDGKQVDVSCKEINEGSDDSKSRTKRSSNSVGTEQEQDTEDTQYEQLAEESLEKFLQTSGGQQHYSFIKVDEATTQVVSGILIRINFTVSPTDCQIDSDGQPTSSKCNIVDSTDVTTCHSRIWEQQWRNIREINVTCPAIEIKSITKREVRGSLIEHDKFNYNYRNKRYSLGAEKERNCNDPKYQELAEESLQKYLQTSGNTKAHKVVNVKKVTIQVVSGTLTRIDFVASPTSQNSGDIINCHSKIWEQPWLNKKDIDVNCQINNQDHRTKRQVPGGEKLQNPNDPKYIELAEESLQKYLQTSANTQDHKVVAVEKVTIQVVSGTLTRIDFVASPTSQNSGDVINCHSKIWAQPWLNKKDIDVDCQINNQVKRTKRQLIGGQTAQNPNDPKYKELAMESLQKYLQTTGNTQPHRVDQVTKVTTQVVSGLYTRINFVSSPIDQDSGDVITCFTEIWERPWLNSKDITVNCTINEQNSRIKRETFVDSDEEGSAARKRLQTGPNKEQDPSKNEYRSLAQDSLREYQRLHKIAHAHKVKEVKRVFTKVVSGIIYNIDYIAVPTICSANVYDVANCKKKKEGVLLYCHTRIWNQPWLHKKKITVSCNPHVNDKSKNTRRLPLKSFYGVYDSEIEEKRNKRQAHDDLDDIDEDLSYYYADRAMQHINKVSNSDNLNKLVTIHSLHSGVHMGANMVRLYIEIAPTFCLRHADENELPYCDEIDGSDHKLCLAKLWPSPHDELVVQTISVVCDDNIEFKKVTGLYLPELVEASIREIERTSDQKYRLVHAGEPRMVPSLYSDTPLMLSFIVGYTNCTKDVDLSKNFLKCFLDTSKTARSCTSFIWFVPNTREIYQVNVTCGAPETRQKRSVSLNSENATSDDVEIQKLVKESLEKLEMASIHKYKQRVFIINSYSTKLTSGKVTTIDFDVGYTSCLKYEWVEDETTCEFLEHLPRRHCVAQIFERLWVRNGKNIDITCEDDETPLEAHIEFESAEMAMELARSALKHIEAKYPHPRKQKVVRIFSLDKQVVAGIHYRMKIEVGLTNCTALSDRTDCKLVKDDGLNKFCRVNVWMRPWTDHPPNFRVTCDYQEGATAEVYHHLQAEHLFNEFLATYEPDYLNDHVQMRHRFEIFRANVRKIHELNTYERGTATYGVTRFADLSYDEFSSKYMGLKPSLRDHNQVPMPKAEIPIADIPDKFDWRDFEAVTEVKDQGSCGSCWAFSVTGNIEGQWKMQSGQLVSLSEQELVDCDKLDEGCNGGLPDNAYRAIEQLGGLETEKDYPYEGEGDRCMFNKTLSKVQISGAVNISTNETDMAKWLVQNGPISIGINANAMQFYMGGISHPWRMLCNPSNLDHGVLIVGYGTKDYPLFHKRLPYWTIKNSWGKSWGEQGYYRVFRGDGTCGVNQMASSAVI